MPVGSAKRYLATVMLPVEVHGDLDDVEVSARLLTMLSCVLKGLQSTERINVLVPQGEIQMSRVAIPRDTDVPDGMTLEPLEEENT